MTFLKFLPLVFIFFSTALYAQTHEHGHKTSSNLHQSVCQPWAEYQPGDECFMHDILHESYKDMFFEINAAWLEENLTPGQADELYEARVQLASTGNSTDPEDLGPGDYDFMTDSLRALYVTMYANTKCHCDYASCRPTAIRLATAEESAEYTSDKTGPKAFSGYMVYVDQSWEPVTQGVIHHEKHVSADLWEALMGPVSDLEMTVDGHPVNGHICKLRTGTVECVMVPRLHG